MNLRLTLSTRLSRLFRTAPSDSKWMPLIFWGVYLLAALLRSRRMGRRRLRRGDF